MRQNVISDGLGLQLWCIPTLYSVLQGPDQDEPAPEDKMKFWSHDNVKHDKTLKNQQYKKNDLEQRCVGKRKEWKTMPSFSLLDRSHFQANFFISLAQWPSFITNTRNLWFSGVSLVYFGTMVVMSHKQLSTN